MPSKYKALNDASRLAHAELTGASPCPEDVPWRRESGKPESGKQGKSEPRKV